MSGNTLYATVTVVSLVGAVAYSALHYMARGRAARAGGPAGGSATLKRFGLIERASYVFLTLTLLALAFTGMAPALVAGANLEGWMLMAHVGVGGAFMFLLLLTALLGTSSAAGSEAKLAPEQRCTFWTAMGLGVATTVTMMLSMVPLFGTHGMEVLREVHRYCGLAMVAVGYWHVYLSLVVRRGRISWLLRGKVSPEWAKHYSPQWQAAKQ